MFTNTGRGVHSDWKFICFTKHKVTSVSHINTLCNIEVKKNQAVLHYFFNLEQIKIALLPQAWNLLFIDKVREEEMVLCYEETVDYWFSNLWTGREKSQNCISNPNQLSIFAFWLINTNKTSTYTFFIFFPNFTRVTVERKISFQQLVL